MRFLAFIFAATLACGQGYTQLTGTALTSVCPANGYGWPATMPESFDWADKCFTIVNDWGGATVDTRRNRVLIWGGGHVSYRGNEVYSLELDPAHLSTTYIARTNSTAPTMVRLNNPSVYNTNCTANADGTPESTHSYSGIIYLPKADSTSSIPTVAVLL